jgi:hypothetical protein
MDLRAFWLQIDDTDITHLFSMRKLGAGKSDGHAA